VEQQRVKELFLHQLSLLQYF